MLTNFSLLVAIGSVQNGTKDSINKLVSDLNNSTLESDVVHALNKLSYSKLDSKSVGVREGVVFLTYSSLIASSEKGRSRMQQLVQWFGPEYDGLIVFDECHKAKNLVPEAGSQPTRTGEAVLEIQRDTIRAASEFAKWNLLPATIKVQLLSHVCLKFKTEGLKQQVFRKATIIINNLRSTRDCSK